MRHNELTLQWQVSALRACEILDATSTTPLRAGLFHNGPSGLHTVRSGFWAKSSLYFRDAEASGMLTAGAMYQPARHLLRFKFFRLYQPGELIHSRPHLIPFLNIEFDACQSRG